MGSFRATVADLAKFWGKKLSASVVAIGLVVGLYACLARKESHRDPDGSIHNKGGLWAAGLQAGDCFNAVKDGEVVSSVTAMPCAEAHTAQVYGKYFVQNVDLKHPTDAAVQDEGAKGCAQIKASDVDEPKMPSGSTLTMLVPVDTSWVSGDRTVTCIVEASAAWTGSVMKAAAG